MTSGMRVEVATHGNAFPLCINDSTRANRFPSFPPGCRFAKSSSLNPRLSLRVTASASPNASIVVVEAVGASPSEQASCATEQSKATSPAAAKVEMECVEPACVEFACMERALLPAAFDLDLCPGALIS